MIEVPTASETAAQIMADIEGSIGQSTPVLPKAFIRVLSRALGGVQAALGRLLVWTYAQIHPQTAALESLLLMGERYGLTPRPSVAAVLEIQVIGDPGTNVPASTIWSGGNGLTYIQAALVVIGVGGTVTARATCLEGGEEGSLGVGNTLAAATSVAGVDGASVTAILTEGTDAESTEQYRARILQRMAGQSQGGCAADYVAWACEVPGIVKAFAFRTAVGQVTVYPLMATTGAARLPSAPKIAEVLAYVDNPSRRPLTADVLVSAMTELAVAVTITTLNPGDDTTKAAIVAELTRYFYAAYPRQYPDEENPTNVITVAAIWAAIRDAGASAASVVMSVAGTGEVTRYELADDEIVKIGTVTWA